MGTTNANSADGRKDKLNLLSSTQLVINEALKNLATTRTCMNYLKSR